MYRVILFFVYVFAFAYVFSDVKGPKHYVQFKGLQCKPLETGQMFKGMTSSH